MINLMQEKINKFIDFLTPNALAFGNPLALQKSATSEQLKQKLLPGDIIFSSTDSMIFEVSRTLMQIQYDHVAVVINSKYASYMSPLVVGKIQLDYIIHPKRNPLILRPKVEDKEAFEKQIQNIQKENLQVISISKFILKEVKQKLTKKSKPLSFEDLRKSKICMDIILNTLCKCSNKIKSTVKQYKRGEIIQNLNFYLPDEGVDMLRNHSQIIIQSSHQNYQHQKLLNKAWKEKSGNELQKIKDAVNTTGNHAEKNNQSKQNPQEQKKKIQQQKKQIIKIFQHLINFTQLFGLGVQSKIQTTLMIFHIIIMVGHIRQIDKIPQSDPKL